MRMASNNEKQPKGFYIHRRSSDIFKRLIKDPDNKALRAEYKQAVYDEYNSKPCIVVNGVCTGKGLMLTPF